MLQATLLRQGTSHLGSFSRAWHDIGRMPRQGRQFAAAYLAVVVAIVTSATVANAQSCVPAPSGIVSWYTMDGSTADRQIANTPSATNAVSFVAGKVAQGATFGSGGFIDIPDSASLALQRITLDAWARPDGPGPNNDAAGSIIVGKNTDNNGVSVQLAWTAQSGGRFRFNFPGNSIVSTDAFPAGSFYFVAGTYDGSTFRLYVNGVLEGSVASVQTITYTSLPWNIGANTPGARSIGFPRTWNGVIDEVEILNRALSASEINAIFAAGAAGKCKTFACDPAPSGVIAWWAGDGNASDRADGNGGTVQNGATFTTGLVGQAFSFDGVDDYVSFVNRPVADLFGNQFTIEYWANPGATADRPTWGFSGSGTFNTNNPIASYDSWLTFGNGAGGNQLINPLPNAAANGWTHYAIVADGTNTYRVYVNGSQISSAAISVRPASAGNRTFIIGQSGFSSGFENYFKGALDEFTLYNRGLSQAEIQGIVDAGPAGKCKNTCGNGILEPGEQCDDGNTVNGDCCSSTCQITNVGSACDDGVACTYNDTCSASGVCTGTSITCTSDQCNTRTCNGTSTCAVTPRTGASCDDGDPCTYGDACSGSGVCVGASITCASDQCNTRACNGTSTCSVTPLSGVACDDGNPCTSGETCQAGVCGNPTSGVTCTALDQCHDVGTCDPTTGVCSNPPRRNGTPCTDGNACTIGESCQNGACGAPTSTVNCGTPDQCHDQGTCNPATGICSNPAKPDGTACNDGNACTSGETCEGGACGSPTSTVICGPPDQCHDQGTCNPATGVCSNPAKQNGTPCNDANACTSGETCEGGVCGSPTSTVNCSTQDQCHDPGTCNPATGVCSNPSKPDGATCDDGNACTGGETCQGGTCGTPTSTVTCTQLDQCHVAGSCDPHTGTCSNPPKPDGSACTDNDACTRSDTCQTGACLGASPVACTAQDQCHEAGVCNPVTGACSNPAKPDGVGCNDGNACTRVDACRDGSCVGSDPVTCTALDQCHIAGTCNPATGTCSDLIKPNGTDCDDGSACTTADTCQNGSCVGGLPPSCDDGNVCTDDGCNPGTGCTHTNNTRACTDGLFCNGPDHCSGGRCSVHAGDPCTGGAECNDTCNETAKNCLTPSGATCTDDGNVCTDDRCDGAGTCTHPDNTASCDDLNPCTLDDTCRDGSCAGTPKTCDDGQFCDGVEDCDFTTGDCVTVSGSAPTCDDGMVCTTDRCDPSANDDTGACVNAVVTGCCTSDAQCDDGLACNGRETCDTRTGACHDGAPVVCDDGDVCTTDTCTEPGGRCTFPAVAGCCNVDTDCDDGSACTADTCDTAQHICHHTDVCDDGRFCNGVETCNPAGTACVAGTPPDCNDGSVCTTDACDDTLGQCTHTPVAGCCAADANCNDGDVCTTDTCATATGICHYAAVAGCCNVDGDCNDGNPCTTDRCDTGSHTCSHGIVDCDDGAVCTTDFCDAGAGCQHVNVPNCCVNDSDCDDHDVCDGRESCVNNQCRAGTAADCDDHNPCTDDSCDPQVGCLHVNNARTCDDGDACTSNDTCAGGQCRGGPAVSCDDGNPCTTDSCSPASGCVHTNNTNPCSDGNACTMNDTCSGGRCVGGASLDCDDHNPCTTDSCDPTAGCAHVDNTNSCDDGNACTRADTCQAGRCVGTNPVVCAGSDQCHVPGTCNPATGQCSNPSVPDGTACNDGDACTGGDACIAGVCTGTGDTGGPLTTGVTANPNPVQYNATFTLTATVSDATTGGGTVASARYTADGVCPAGSCSMSASDGSFNSPTENVTATVGPLATGVYDVCVYGKDSCGQEGPPSCVLVAVYDPNAGFVTGGGWINSPAGAYRPNPQVSGRANFGFVSQYKKGTTVPTGETEFQFQAGGLNFHSTSYDWLTVSGARAQYKGSGTVNGAGSYGFMLTAIDGQVTGGGGTDKFRIKIWDNNNGGTIVYDNQLPSGTCTDTSDTATPCTAIAGGSIVIHK